MQVVNLAIALAALFVVCTGAFAFVWFMSPKAKKDERAEVCGEKTRKDQLELSLERAENEIHRARELLAGR